MKKILVVDNDRFMREFMNDGLSKEGHHVVTAEDGLSALDVLETYRPDVIFVDLVMPNIDGKKLCKIVRNMEEHKDVHIIILSSAVLEEEVDLGELGANACIAKGPFHEMAKNIRSALEQADLPLEPEGEREVMGIESSFPRAITEEFLSMKKHFEVIFQNMTEGFVEVNAEGRIVYCNQSALSLANMTEEELLGYWFLDLFEGDSRERVREFLKSKADESKEMDPLSDVTLKQQNIALKIVPLKNDKSRSIVFLNNVTELKRTQRAVEKAKEELEYRVNERTSELREAGELLKAEIGQYKQAEKKFEELKVELSEANSLLKTLTAKREKAEKALTHANEKIQEQAEELDRKDKDLGTQLDRIKASEQALKRANQELEEKIRQQTQELSRIQEGMKEEAGKYRQSEDALRRANQELEEKVRHQEEMLSQNTERLKQEMAQSERLEEALRQREADLRKYTHRPPTEKPAAEAPPPEPAADPVLELTLGDHVIRMDMGRETLTLGRDDKNDLVIAEDNVSRSHAVIERAGKDFFLVDRSTNGTFVKVSGKQGFLLKKNKYRLAGTGAIGLGRIVELDSSFALKFRLLQRTVPPGPQADQ